MWDEVASGFNFALGVVLCGLVILAIVGLIWLVWNLIWWVDDILLEREINRERKEKAKKREEERGKKLE